MRDEKPRSDKLRLSKETLRRIEPAVPDKPGLFPLPPTTRNCTNSGTCPTVI
ncbi:MAG TPA: hypothetical protein VHM02_08265 [Thermoanaerobaculia bacterium]|nr:hypothetical protein [Thermoanaerobaculia bacterium]